MVIELKSLRHSLRRTSYSDLVQLENAIIFIEENNNFIYSKDFVKFVQEFENYFVLGTRHAIRTYTIVFRKFMK